MTLKQLVNFEFYWVCLNFSSELALMQLFLLNLFQILDTVWIERTNKIISLNTNRLGKNNDLFWIRNLNIDLIQNSYSTIEQLWNKQDFNSDCICTLLHNSKNLGKTVSSLNIRTHPLLDRQVYERTYGLGIFHPCSYMLLATTLK